jgi:hypothetical protein
LAERIHICDDGKFTRADFDVVAEGEGVAAARRAGQDV